MSNTIDAYGNEIIIIRDQPYSVFSSIYRTSSSEAFLVRDVNGVFWYLTKFAYLAQPEGLVKLEESSILSYLMSKSSLAFFRSRFQEVVKLCFVRYSSYDLEWRFALLVSIAQSLQLLFGDFDSYVQTEGFLCDMIDGWNAAKVTGRFLVRFPFHSLEIDGDDDEIQVDPRIVKVALNMIDAIYARDKVISDLLEDKQIDAGDTMGLSYAEYRSHTEYQLFRISELEKNCLQLQIDLSSATQIIVNLKRRLDEEGISYDENDRGYDHEIYDGIF